MKFLLLCIGIVIIIKLLGVILLRQLMSKLRWALPPLQWMTFEDVRALGYPQEATKWALVGLHRTRELEIRLYGNLTANATGLIDQFGFSPITIEFHEFRLLPSRGKRNRKRRLKQWDLSLQPV